MKKAKIIAIEGPDNLGKTTQCNLLKELLGDKLYLEKIPYKDKNTFEEIYQIIKSGEVSSKAKEIQVLAKKNRDNWAKEVWPKINKKYDFVVLDRWALSGYVYGKYFNLDCNTLSYLLECEIQPECYLIFHGENFTSRKEKKDCIDENLELQKFLKKEYVEWHRENFNSKIRSELVYANLPKEKVFSQIKNYLQI